MNTDQERAILAVAEEGPYVDGDVDSPPGRFGVAHVTPALEQWLAQEHDLDLPPEGWYMVSQNSDGVIFVMPGSEELCFRWFDAAQFAYACWEPDEVTEEARLVLSNVEPLYRLALFAGDADNLRHMVSDTLAEDHDIDPDDVDWAVLYQLVVVDA